MTPRLCTIGLLLGCAGCATRGSMPMTIPLGPPPPAALRDTPALDLRLADATLSAGAGETALHVLDTMLARDPDNVAALARRGQALLLLDRPEDAAASFARAAALRPSSIEALTGLARARSKEGNAKDAEAAWRLALARAPADARVRIGLAISLDLQDRHAEAQALYRAVLAGTPDDAAARADLGLSLALSGHTAEALPMLRQAASGGFGDDARAAARARHDFAAGLVLAGDDTAARAELSADLPPAQVDPAIAGLRRFAASRQANSRSSDD